LVGMRRDKRRERGPAQNIRKVDKKDENNAVDGDPNPAIDGCNPIGREGNLTLQHRPSGNVTAERETSQEYMVRLASCPWRPKSNLRD